MSNSFDTKEYPENEKFDNQAIEFKVSEEAEIEQIKERLSKNWANNGSGPYIGYWDESELTGAPERIFVEGYPWTSYKVRSDGDIVVTGSGGKVVFKSSELESVYGTHGLS
jgi:hypothetical protein